ncbi:MAG: elongation factor Ts [Gammaproteobacteria bacterium]|nr:elongation factor Ts [Gammaproteobacteria bacterium]NIM73827.1 elongation factor Ts [Gammaproteobacteria bacterium]NIN39404.1 elongation factor Ts [Gammaproteobacteria bacterium]NIO25069.1 elongation factor Ts [Gammaproteobacteria bacterium]NIO65701.1 elongation factor Ts [Gammaproteobacteria bacterium]
MQITAAMVKELRERTGAGMMECKQALVDEAGDIEAAVENLRKKGQAKADKKAGRIAAEGVIGLALSADGTSGALAEVNSETDFVAKQDEFRQFADKVAERVLDERPEDLGALLAVAFEAGSDQSIEERMRDMVMRIGENITVRRFQVMASDGGHVGSYVHGGRIGVLVDVVGADGAIGKDIAMHVAASRPLAVSESDMPAGALDKEREILAAQVADSGKPPEIQEKMISGRLKKYLGEVTLLGQPFVKDPDQSVEKFLAGAGAKVEAFARFEVGEGIEKRSENFAEEVMAQVQGD